MTVLTNGFELDYIRLQRMIMDIGVKSESRAGHTHSLFGTVLKVAAGVVPLIRGRKMSTQGIVGEFCTFMSEDVINHVDQFKKRGCNYWQANAKADGSLNIDYGNLWHNFNGQNQLRKAELAIKHDPTSRRILVTGWNPVTAEAVDLPCCHMLYQWNVTPADAPNPARLDMIFTMRSVDVMLGLPSDLLLGYLMNALMAKQVGLAPGMLIFMLGNTHIYDKHIPQMIDYQKQEFIITTDTHTTVQFSDKATIYAVEPEDITIKTTEGSSKLQLQYELLGGK